MESQASNLRINKSGEVTFNAGLSCFKGFVHPKLWRMNLTTESFKQLEDTILSVWGCLVFVFCYYFIYLCIYFYV